MSQYYGAFILLIISLLNFSIAASEEERAMEKEESEVLETIETMTSALGNKDIASVLSSYETGAAIMFEPGTKVSDTAVIRQMFEGSFQINPQFSYPSGHEVYIANDIALHIAPWVMKGETPDGTDIEQVGLSVAVLRKQKDDKWLLVLDNPHGQHLMENN